MPFPFIPLAIAGLNALGGLRGTQNRSTSDTQTQLNRSEESQRNFGQNTASNFSQAFQPAANAALTEFFRPTSSAQFIDPSTFSRNFFNLNAQQVNDSSRNAQEATRARLQRQGLSNSAVSSLSRGIGELGRSRGLVDVAGQAANQNLFIRQLNDQFRNNAAQVEAQRRGSLVSLLGALPRSTDTSGFSNLSGSISQNQNTTTQTTGRQGGGLTSAVGNFIGTPGLGNIPGFNNLLGIPQASTGFVGNSNLLNQSGNFGRNPFN